MKIKDKRMSLGLTQDALGKKLGVGRTAVAMWENGEAIPRADKLPRLAQIFGCNIDELFGESTGTKKGNDLI